MFPSQQLFFKSLHLIFTVMLVIHPHSWNFTKKSYWQNGTRSLSGSDSRIGTPLSYMAILYHVYVINISFLSCCHVATRYYQG